VLSFCVFYQVRWQCWAKYFVPKLQFFWCLLGAGAPTGNNCSECEEEERAAQGARELCKLDTQCLCWFGLLLVLSLWPCHPTISLLFLLLQVPSLHHTSLWKTSEQFAWYDPVRKITKPPTDSIYFGEQYLSSELNDKAQKQRQQQLIVARSSLDPWTSVCGAPVSKKSGVFVPRPLVSFLFMWRHICFLVFSFILQCVTLLCENIVFCMSNWNWSLQESASNLGRPKKSETSSQVSRKRKRKKSGDKTGGTVRTQVFDIALDEILFFWSRQSNLILQLMKLSSSLVILILFW
jgi:hypothetical protein